MICGNLNFKNGCGSEASEEDIRALIPPLSDAVFFFRKICVNYVHGVGSLLWSLIDLKKFSTSLPLVRHNSIIIYQQTTIGKNDYCLLLVD